MNIRENVYVIWGINPWYKRIIILKIIEAWFKDTHLSKCAPTYHSELNHN